MHDGLDPGRALSEPAPDPTEPAGEPRHSMGSATAGDDGGDAAARRDPRRDPQRDPLRDLLIDPGQQVEDAGPNDAEGPRLAALSRYPLTNAVADPVLVDLLRIATTVCGTRKAAVNIIAADEQWPIATIGVAADRVPRADSFCAVTIEQPTTMVLPDAAHDPRVAQSGHVTGRLDRIGSYAGAVLATDDGERLGALCVFDDEPRDFDLAQVEMLERLASLAVARLEALRAGLLLARTEELFRLAFDGAPIGMAILDLEHHYVRVNPAFAAMVGYDVRALTAGLGPLDLTHPDDIDADLELMRQLAAGERATYRLEKRYRHRQGHELWVELWGGLVRDADAEPVAYVKQVSDITDRKQLEQGLIHQATHDALTGLPNRVLLQDRIRQALAAQRRAGCTAVLSLDLDGFKPINDQHGHPAGDEVLIEVARRLRRGVRTHDSVCRIGGDEFVVVTYSEHDWPGHARDLAGRLQAQVAAPIALRNGSEVQVSVTIGGVVLRRVDGPHAADLLTPAALLEASDRALYVAKRRQRGSTEFVDHPAAD